MDRTITAIRLASLAFLAAGVLAAGDVAFGQQVREIIVVAPEVVHHTVGRSSIGAPIEQISITHRVSYADLDLSRQADVATLHQRINDAANLGCKQLKDLYPLEEQDPNCVKVAVDGAMTQADAAVAAAPR